MTINSSNRLFGSSSDDSSERGGDAHGNKIIDRGQFVRQRLATIGPVLENSKIEVGDLLEECYREGYWKLNYSTFPQYVDKELEFSIRTAQELIRVIRACRKANVPISEISRLGWSKVAVVASQLTAENAAQVLAEVSSKSYSELKATVQRTTNLKKQGRSPRRRENKVTLTEPLQKALRLACVHTHDPDLQPNLEFIAAKFIELCPLPSRVPSSESLN